MKTFRSEGFAAVVAAVVIASIGVSAGAQAPPSVDEASGDPQVAEARTAFREGTALARQSQWGEALLAFERSARLRPHTFTSYNLGYCERALGRYTRARKFLAKALAENDARGGAALAPDIAAEAKRYLSEIEQRLAKATITITPSDAAISVDGRPLEVVAGDRHPPVFAAGTRDLGAGEMPSASVFELLVDPGAHVFTLSRRGSTDVVSNRSFVPGSAASFVLELVVAPAESEKSAALRPVLPAPPVREAARPNRTAGYLLLGAAGVGLAIGTVAGIVALQDKKKLDEACKGTACPPSLEPTRDSLNRWADVSTIAFSLGAVSMVASTILLIAGGSPPPSTNSSAPAKTGFVIRPSFGPGSASVSGSF